MKLFRVGTLITCEVANFKYFRSPVSKVKDAQNAVNGKY